MGRVELTRPPTTNNPLEGSALPYGRPLRLDKVSVLRRTLSEEWSTVATDPGRGTPVDRLLLWKWLRLAFETDPSNSARRIPFPVVASVRPERELSPLVRDEVVRLLGRLHEAGIPTPFNLPTTPTGSAAAAALITHPGERAALAYLDFGTKLAFVGRIGGAWLF